MALFTTRSPAEVFHDIQGLIARGAERDALVLLRQFIAECGCYFDTPGSAFYLNWAARALRTCAELCMHSDPRKAAGHYEDARKFHQRAGALIDEAACLNNAADCYAALGDAGAALSCYQQAFSLIENTPYGRGHAICLVNIARTLWRIQRYDEALKAATTGLRVVTVAGDHDRQKQFLAIIAAIQDSGLAGSSSDTPPDCGRFAGDAARLVAAQEARFTTQQGKCVRMLCDAARNLLPEAIHALTSDELKAVVHVPVTSWPTRGVNAFVARLSSGEYLINIGPELLLVMFSVFRACYDGLFASRHSRSEESLEEVFARMGTVLVHSISNQYEFADAANLSDAFLGKGGWTTGCCWIILHECGHLLLGHLLESTARIRPVAGAWLELNEQELTSVDHEFEADAFATERTVRAFTKNIGEPDDIAAFVMAAVTVVFSALTAMSFVSTAIRGKPAESIGARTHPDNAARLDRIQLYLESEFPSRKQDVARCRSYIEHVLLSDAARALWLSIVRRSVAKGMFADHGKAIGTV